MRWSNYVLFMTCLTLMLYLGGFSNIAGDNSFNGWLTNMAGRNSTNVNLYNTSDNFTGTNPLNITDLATGKTQGSPGNSSGLLGMFGVPDSSILSGNLLLLLGGFAFIAVTLGFLGFSANFIIPLLILMGMIFMNLFIFPLNFLFQQDMPSLLKVFIPTILNLLFVLAVMDFMRGGA
jgi:hypothetical protein